MLFRFFIAFLLCFFLAASVSAQELPAPKLKIVASFSILGDIARQVGGEDVEVSVLVGVDGDAHTYQPTTDDAKKLAAADIIAINGLKFEGWMTRLIAASGSKAKLLVASAGVKPRVMEAEEEKEASHHHHHHEHGKELDGGIVVDPHAWQDLQNGAIYARNIAGAIIKARLALKERVEARAAAYTQKIEALDKEVKAAFAAIPAERRKIITGHDAFGYFGRAYGVRFIAPVGISTEAEPSAAAVAKLTRQVKEEGVKRVFVENMTNPRLIEQLAKDSGASLGGTLYADALSGPSGPAPDYLTMMRHNADLMEEAMR